ncbi:hypothetical protein RGE_07880 [Rubrivivax gelatinosus IL144]|uniref:Uncharacterized protein n=1 Tax=Rubrivivax gelatinosus (strain NBRC 100245 / IL144) TaxID=983917 RepID=I0HM94_RUBGI|nr:hypothetical protein RGE_07880 [Rubrivivax gelatinosus IL144]
MHRRLRGPSAGRDEIVGDGDFSVLTRRCPPRDGAGGRVSC